MQIALGSSIGLSLVASLVLVGSLEACGGTASSIGPDGGLVAGEGGVVAEGGSDGGSDAEPGYDEPLSIFGAYAVQTVFLGETDRAGALSKDAWKEYGENLDGLVSGKTANGECKLLGGADASKREDGARGIDNAFGRTILGFITGLTPTPSKTANGEIAKGGRTMVLSLLPPAEAASARFAFLTGASANAPTWGGSDVYAIAESSVASGTGDPRSVSTTPGMRGHRVSSGIASGTFHLELSIGGTTLPVPIRHARVTMDISADGLRATNGVLAGIVPTAELVTGVERLAGRISAQLCSGATLDAITQSYRQASDILLDGSQDPAKDCEGVSIGIGFEAVKVTASGIQPEPPPGPDPCP